MKIGIDISQLAYERTGVANYLRSLVQSLINNDHKNEYILFYSSLRRKFDVSALKIPKDANVSLREFRFPPKLLHILWNRLHVLPIENLIGNVDLFITSDWIEPPTKKAKKATILYDLIIYKHPDETAEKIIKTQKQKLKWVKKETDMVFCISEATKRDAVDVLKIDPSRLQVLYPGV